jgi:hypothetical protein
VRLWIILLVVHKRRSHALNVALGSISGCFMKCAAFFTIAGIGFCFSAIGLPLVSGSRRSIALKLDVALLGDRSLLDRYHLAFHICQFGCGLLVAANEERGWPEDYDGRCCHEAVLGPLTILSA